MVMKKKKYPSSNKRTNVGRLSLFSRTTGFRYICLYVRTESVLYFFLKIEGSQEPSPILDFFQGKKVQFSSLVVLSNSRTAEFFGRSSQARSQKLQYSFWKLIFYIIIFLPKMDFEYISVVYKSIIYFKKFIQIVLTPLLSLHLSQ
jgi:hypothetical protein